MTTTDSDDMTTKRSIAVIIEFGSRSLVLSGALGSVNKLFDHDNTMASLGVYMTHVADKVSSACRHG